MRTPSSSSAPTGRSRQSEPISAGSRATSCAGSRARLSWRASSPIRSCSPAGCASSASISAEKRSIRCTRPRSNASARARPIAPTSSASKVSLATTLHRSRGGLFIAHAKALPGNPYDGHTLATVIPEIETQIGANLARIVADRGYRGHNAPPDHKFKVYISGQRRRVTETIKRQLRRRSAVEPVIGHAKAEHRMGRNYLAGAHGDAANAVLAAAGYNFRRLLAWLAALWRVFIMAVLATATHDSSFKPA